MDITRFLPNNEYQAAVNANAPTAINPFATIADIPAAPLTLYNADGIINVLRTVASNNKLLFDFAAGTNNTDFFIDPISGLTSFQSSTPSTNATFSLFANGNWSIDNLVGVNGDISYIYGGVTDLTLGFTEGLGGTEEGFYIANTGVLVRSQTSLTGMSYAADYSTNGIANFGARWIPDKGWVDSAISGVNTLYTADGALAGARTITMGANTLLFTGNQTTFRGFGTTGGTSALVVQNSDSSSQFQITDDGRMILTSPHNSGSGLALLNISSTSGNAMVNINCAIGGDSKLLFQYNGSNNAWFYSGNGIATIHNIGIFQFRNMSNNAIHTSKNSEGEWVFDNDVSGLTTPTIGTRIKIIGSGTTSATNSLLLQKSTGAEVMRVRDDGFVGIGISTQIGNEMLRVNGNFATTGVASFGNTTTAGATLNAPSDWGINFGDQTSLYDSSTHSAAWLRTTRGALKVTQNNINTYYELSNDTNKSSISHLIASIKTTGGVDQVSNAEYKMTSSYWDGAAGQNKTGSIILNSANTTGYTLMKFDVEGGTKMVIDENGFVGVNTASPTSLFNILGKDNSWSTNSLLVSNQNGYTGTWAFKNNGNVAQRHEVPVAGNGGWNYGYQLVSVNNCPTDYLGALNVVVSGSNSYGAFFSNSTYSSNIELAAPGHAIFSAKGTKGFMVGISGWGAVVNHASYGLTGGQVYMGSDSIAIQTIGNGTTAGTTNLWLRNSALATIMSVTDDGLCSLVKGGHTLTLNANGTSTLTEVDTTNIGFQLNSTNGYLRMNVTGGAANALIYTNGAATGLTLSGAVAGTAHLTINSSGNVGIGTAPATSKVTVSGDIETINNTNGLIVLDRTNATRYRIYTDGGVLYTEPA